MLVVFVIQITIIIIQRRNFPVVILRHCTVVDDDDVSASLSQPQPSRHSRPSIQPFIPFLVLRHSPPATRLLMMQMRERDGSREGRGGGQGRTDARVNTDERSCFARDSA